jgi:hypothetical protein
MASLQAEAAEAGGADPVGSLIGELEAVVLRMAREIDGLRARVGELERAALATPPARQEPGKGPG